MKLFQKRLVAKILALIIAGTSITGGMAGCSSTGHHHVELEQRVDYLGYQVDTLNICARDFSKKYRGMEDSLTQLKQRIGDMQRGFASYAVPEEIFFAGFIIRFDTPDKKRRLDEAIMFMINNQARLQIMYARSASVFPLFDNILAEEQTSPDFKYVSVVESGLSPRAKSYAGASDPWQFMPATGTQYGLQQTPTVDERWSLEKSTQAAAKHLRYLLGEFADVMLALAANNYGEGNLTQAMERQGTGDYFQLWLPQETEEYVLRVFAAKLIFEDPGRYGVVLETRPYLGLVDKDTVTVKVNNHLTARMVADWCGTVYREIRLLNPELLSDAWGPGTYVISLPKGTRKAFLAGLSSLRKKK